MNSENNNQGLNFNTSVEPQVVNQPVQPQVIQTVPVQPQVVQTQVVQTIPVQQMNQVSNETMNNQAQAQNNQIDVNQMNQVNDLVMVKEVKSNPKVVYILIGVIILIIGIIIWEVFHYLGGE